MSDLKEEHVDAFFLEGDAGTYEGGPTLAPVGFADVEVDEATRGPTPEQIVRRERYTRLVKKLVGSLAAASFVLFAFRAGRATQKDDFVPATNAAYVAIDRSTPAVTPAPAEPSPKADPIAVAPASEAAVMPVPAIVPAAPAEPTAKSEAHGAAQTTALAEKSSAHSASASPPAPRHAESRAVRLDATSKASSSKASSSDASEHAAALRPAIVTTIAARSAGSNGHAPPTATFPD